MLLNKRVAALQPSPTLTLSAKAKALKQQGVPVINLSAGELDLGTPDFARDAGIKAIRDNFTKYTAVDGIKELKHAIAQWLQKDLGQSYTHAEIIVTVGAKQAIFNALFATLNDGDEVLVPAPYWVSYPAMVSVVGGCPRILDCNDQLKLTPDALEANLSARVKWLLLNTPNNPTGAVYNRNELKALADVLEKYPDVLVLSDDIYREIAYTDVPHLLQVAPCLKDRVLMVNGVSKSYAMTGWRIGYAVGPKDLVRAMSKVQSQQTSNPCSIAQKASSAALSDQSHWLPQLRARLQERRDFLVPALNTLGLTARMPEGAFYVYASCENVLGRKTPDGTILDTDIAVASYFLDVAHVAMVPGDAFGKSPYLRISYACSQDELNLAVTRLQKALDAL
jgi:aspartate aminotransferase